MEVNWNEYASNKFGHGEDLSPHRGELVASDIDRLFVIELDSIDWRQTETDAKGN